VEEAAGAETEAEAEAEAGLSRHSTNPRLRCMEFLPMEAVGLLDVEHLALLLSAESDLDHLGLLAICLHSPMGHTLRRPMAIQVMVHLLHAGPRHCMGTLLFSKQA